MMLKRHKMDEISSSKQNNECAIVFVIVITKKIMLQGKKMDTNSAMSLS